MKKEEQNMKDKIINVLARTDDGALLLSTKDNLVTGRKNT